MERKEIVALILEKNGRFLVEKRKSSESLTPNSIIFPAGHVKSGEQKEQALIREMKEELGIEIYNPALVHQADFDCEEKQAISWYSCSRYEGRIQTREAEKVFWISPSQSQLLTHQVSKDALSSYLNSKK